MANYKIFPLRLSDGDREAMEAHRIRLGLRSGAETIRCLLLSPSPHSADVPSAFFNAQIAQPRSVAAVPILSRKAFNPQPKQGKKK